MHKTPFGHSFSNHGMQFHYASRFMITPPSARRGSFYIHARMHYASSETKLSPAFNSAFTPSAICICNPQNTGNIGYKDIQSS